MKLWTALILCGIGAGAWYTWDHQDDLGGLVGSYIENRDFLTLEARYTPEQIMDAHRKDLLVDSLRSYQDPILKFYPYLLMEVKYTLPDRAPKEGVILWSQVDGEMVLNTDSWEKTHGFEDAINAQANRTEFKLLNTLAHSGGTMTRDQLARDLRADHDQLDAWLQTAKQKHLVILRGNLVQLHIQNPKISVMPQTRIMQSLVTKPYNHAQRVPIKYTRNQIEKTAQSAFGSDFTVKNSKEVFLPVYNIEVLNPDGSILTTYWNALNGQQIRPKYLEELP